MDDEGTELMTFQIPASNDAPVLAREAVNSVIGNWEAAGDVLLATSELVSNAVIHGELSADDPIQLDVRATAEQVRVSVRHDGPAFERAAVTRAGRRTGGFGFHIVGSVAKRWDVSHRDGQTEAWFEI